jgi:hypothetical protein
MCSARLPHRSEGENGQPIAGGSAHYATRRRSRRFSSRWAASFMKVSEGLTKFWPTMTVFALFVTGAALQTLAMKREDLAVTYLSGGGIGSHSCVSVRCPGVQRELQSGTNCRRIAHRAWHHLVAFSLLTHKMAADRTGTPVPSLARPRVSRSKVPANAHNPRSPCDTSESVAADC